MCCCKFSMKTLNKFLLLGLVAAAALFTTGMANTLGFQEAYAVNQNIGCNNNAGVNVCANVNVCAQAITIGSQQKC